MQPRRCTAGCMAANLIHTWPRPQVVRCRQRVPHTCDSPPGACAGGPSLAEELEAALPAAPAGVPRAQRLPAPPPEARRSAARELVLAEPLPAWLEAAPDALGAAGAAAPPGPATGASACWDIEAGHGAGAASGLAQLLAAVPAAGADWRAKTEAFDALGGALRRPDAGVRAELPAHVDRLLAALLEHLGAKFLTYPPDPALCWSTWVRPQLASMTARHAVPWRGGHARRAVVGSRLAGAAAPKDCMFLQAVWQAWRARLVRARMRWGGRRRAPARGGRHAGGARGRAARRRAPVRAAPRPPHAAALRARSRQQGATLLTARVAAPGHCVRGACPVRQTGRLLSLIHSCGRLAVLCQCVHLLSRFICSPDRAEGRGRGTLPCRPTSQAQSSLRVRPAADAARARRRRHCGAAQRRRWRRCRAAWARTRCWARWLARWTRRAARARRSRCWTLSPCCCARARSRPTRPAPRRSGAPAARACDAPPSCEHSGCCGAGLLCACSHGARRQTKARPARRTRAP
jgi:hypothetical protein